MRKVKFIVIDGTDGSGKATQMALLVKNLRLAGRRVKVEDFPQYGQKSAVLVEEYLNGRFGTAKDLGPYIPSIFYAVDRFAASRRIRENLKKGYVVVANRYITANLAHQGAKFANRNQQNRYFKWLLDLEYNLFGIPKPDLTLILHMPAKIAQFLVDQKGHRKYLGAKKRDLHEADLAHLRAAERTYLEIAKKSHYPVIECYNKGKILSREKIASSIWNIVKKNL